MGTITKINATQRFNEGKIFSILPDELCLNILQYLDVKSAVKLSLSCHQWQRLSKDETLWSFFCKRDGVLFNPSVKGWKSHYQEAYPLLIALKFPFPGESAVFKKKDGIDWSVNRFFGGNSTLIKKMEFTSTKGNSLLAGFALWGYEDGSYSLVWKMTKKDYNFDYFSSLSLVKKLDYPFFRILIFKKIKDVKKMFLILVKYNEIPEQEKSLLQKLIFSGDWRKITPLTKEEEIEIQRTTFVYYPQKTNRKLGQNNSENRRTLSFGRGLMNNNSFN